MCGAVASYYWTPYTLGFSLGSEIPSPPVLVCLLKLFEPQHLSMLASVPTEARCDVMVGPLCTCSSCIRACRHVEPWQPGVGCCFARSIADFVVRLMDSSMSGAGPADTFQSSVLAHCPLHIDRIPADVRVRTICFCMTHHARCSTLCTLLCSHAPGGCGATHSLQCIFSVVYTCVLCADRLALVVTPKNLFSFNSNPDNLKQFGLHPW